MVYTCFLPFPHLLLLISQWGWLILPTKSIFQIFLLCLIFMVMTHSSSHSMCSSPQGFFQCLALHFFPPGSRKAWSHCLRHSNVSTSVMAPMTQLSKTGPCLLLLFCVSEMFFPLYCISIIYFYFIYLTNKAFLVHNFIHSIYLGPMDYT